MLDCLKININQIFFLSGIGSLISVLLRRKGRLFHLYPSDFEVFICCVDSCRLAIISRALLCLLLIGSWTLLPSHKKIKCGCRFLKSPWVASQCCFYPAQLAVPVGSCGALNEQGSCEKDRWEKHFFSPSLSTLVFAASLPVPPHENPLTLAVARMTSSIASQHVCFYSLYYIYFNYFISLKFKRIKRLGETMSKVYLLRFEVLCVICIKRTEPNACHTCVNIVFQNMTLIPFVCPPYQSRSSLEINKPKGGTKKISGKPD